MHSSALALTCSLSSHIAEMHARLRFSEMKRMTKNANIEMRGSSVKESGTQSASSPCRARAPLAVRAWAPPLTLDGHVHVSCLL